MAQKGKIGSSRRVHSLAWLAIVGASVSCSPEATTAHYTLPAGIVDNEPKSAFGNSFSDFPPEPDGSPFDPLAGRSVQDFADSLIDRRVATFVTYDSDFSMLSGAEFHYFFPVAKAAPGFGLCQSRVYAVTISPSGQNPEVLDTEWQSDVYAVAGSVAPFSAPKADYRDRLNDACEARRDMGLWFRAELADAYTAARLVDLIVAAARKPGSLPFPVACGPFPPDMPARPGCSDDVRSVVASINPRAIVQVDSCDESTSGCLAVGLAKEPQEAATRRQEQWTLEAYFRADPVFRIDEVVVHDTQIIIE